MQREEITVTVTACLPCYSKWFKCVILFNPSQQPYEISTVSYRFAFAKRKPMKVHQPAAGELRLWLGFRLIREEL